MSVSRRDLVRLGSVAVAAAAVGGGLWVQARRRAAGRTSARITGPWPELGAGVQWLLPDLAAAPMEVPDRPHDVEETRDPTRRARVRRVREFTVTTSAQRLRGAPFAPQPEPGVRRLVAIGDSTTFGWGVADGEAWPAQLQAELTRRGHRVEVLNAGVPAQRLEGMLGWLQTQAPALGLHGVCFTRRPYPVPGDPSEVYARTVAAVRAALPAVRVHVILPPVSQFDPHGSSVWESEGAALRARMPDVPVLELTPALRAAQGTRGHKVQSTRGQVAVVRVETGEVVLRAPAVPNGLPRQVYELLEADASVREACFFDDGHLDAEGILASIPPIADALTEAGWFA